DRRRSRESPHRRSARRAGARRTAHEDRIPQFSFEEVVSWYNSGKRAHVMSFQLVVNGRDTLAEGFPPQTTLLDFLRSQGLTGAKEGCAEGECGACAVVMVRPDGAGSTYVPVNSCLMFLPMCAGQEIWTVEALAQNGSLAPAQEAMAAGGGSQC